MTNNNTQRPHAVEVRRTVIPSNGRTLLVYATSEGQVIGQLDVLAVNQEALRAMAHDFPDFVREATGGIAIARGAVPKVPS